MKHIREKVLNALIVKSEDGIVVIDKAWNMKTAKEIGVSLTTFYTKILRLQKNKKIRRLEKNVYEILVN